jgi:septum formation protein
MARLRTPARIILASASPRRRELLRAAGLDFEVRAGSIAEDLPAGISPEEGSTLLALRKARAATAALQAADPIGSSEAIVLAADTIVAIESAGGPVLLGQPADADEARAMLRQLSGSRHKVVTGVCALRARDAETVQGCERTFVTMRVITPAEIEGYVASREWDGKAGGYAIQETADRFVTRLEEGGFDNVVGLPVGLALELLARLGAVVPGRT